MVTCHASVGEGDKICKFQEGGVRQKLVSLLKYTSTFIAVLKVKRIYLKCYLENGLI